jgi:hypothetical protein
MVRYGVIFPNAVGKPYTKLSLKEYGEIVLKLIKTGLIILKKSSGELRKKWFNSGCPLWRKWIITP